MAWAPTSQGHLPRGSLRGAAQRRRGNLLAGQGVATRGDCHAPYEVRGSLRSQGYDGEAPTSQGHPAPCERLDKTEASRSDSRRRPTSGRLLGRRAASGPFPPSGSGSPPRIHRPGGDMSDLAKSLTSELRRQIEAFQPEIELKDVGSVTA